MTALGWTLMALSWLALGYMSVKWIRFNTHIPIPGREQDVRSIARSSVRLDVEDAVQQALESARLKNVARSGGAGW